MTIDAYCPGCGAGRVPGTAFCGACGKAFGEAPAVNIQASVATAQLELEKMRAKLVPLRLLGLVAGLALWWFVAGPALGGNPILTIGSFFVLAGGGVYLGNIAGMLLISDGR